MELLECTIIDGIEIFARNIIEESAEISSREGIDGLSMDCFQFPTDLWRKGSFQSHPQQLPSFTLTKRQTRQSRARSRSTVGHPTKISGNNVRGDEASLDIGMCPVKKRLKRVPFLAHEKTQLRVSHALLNPNTDVLLQRCTTTSTTKKGHT